MPLEIYGRVCRGRKLFSESVSLIYWITTTAPAISRGNVTGRGDCECNYTVNYLKKIEMPCRLPKSQAKEDKCAINQRIYGLNDRKPKQGQIIAAMIAQELEKVIEKRSVRNWVRFLHRTESIATPACNLSWKRGNNAVNDKLMLIKSVLKIS